MSADLNPKQFNMDEFSRWNQGQCGTYATALMKLNPKLRLGGIDFHNIEPDSEFANPGHFAAHDDTHAYDSTGRHPLPYRGIEADEYPGRWIPDIGTPHDFGLPRDEAGPAGSDHSEQANMRAATAHAKRHGILDGKWPK